MKIRSVSSAVILVLAGLLASGSSFASGSHHELRFSSGGKFKIVQFTDIHWKHNSPNGKQVLQTMAYVMDAEQPDFVILTGDIVSGNQRESGWESVIQPMIDRTIPWAAVIGNHDDEQELTRKDIVTFLEKKPYSLTKRGPTDIDGEGNFIIPVRYSGDRKRISAMIYCIDSQAYTDAFLQAQKNKKRVPKRDKYGWIKPSQIEWYRKNSKRITAENGDEPLPSVAFFHIPLPEYNDAWNNTSVHPIGTKQETVCCPSKDTGMFSAMLECQDVMGVFVGHDHDNDYAGLVQGVCLAYGRAMGLDTYGKLAKGARVIEILEGKREFNTWIRTGDGTIHHKIHYPSSFGKATAQQGTEGDTVNRAP